LVETALNLPRPTDLPYPEWKRAARRDGMKHIIVTTSQHGFLRISFVIILHSTWQSLRRKHGLAGLPGSSAAEA
jgi:hypothetical protein